MTKDRPPKPPTDSERQAIQAHRDRQAAQFQAIRLRILGPTLDPYGQPAQNRLLEASAGILDDIDPTPTDPNK